MYRIKTCFGAVLKNYKPTDRSPHPVRNLEPLHPTWTTAVRVELVNKTEGNRQSSRHCHEKAGFCASSDQQRVEKDKRGCHKAKRANRLSFPPFLSRQQKLPNRSGIIESTVRRVLNLRMKGASIYWTKVHAEDIDSAPRLLQVRVLESPRKQSL